VYIGIYYLRYKAIKPYLGNNKSKVRYPVEVYIGIYYLKYKAIKPYLGNNRSKLRYAVKP
jgi:hypothetical protein